MSKGFAQRLLRYVITAAVILTVPLWLGGNAYYLSVATSVGMVAVPAVGAWLLMSSGLWSFGQGAFAAFGAYTGALLVMRVGAPFWAGFLAGGVGAAIAGGLVAYPFLRTSGVAFSILTLVGLLALDETILLLPSLTGGGGGLLGVPPAPVVQILGWRLDLEGSKGAYLLIAVVLLFVLLLVERLQQSGYIRILRAIAQQEPLAEALGVATKRYRASAFVFAAFFTGLAGAFSAFYLQVAYSNVWDLFPSIYIVAYGIVGGAAAILGPVVGAAVIMTGAAALSSVGAGSTASVEPIAIGAGLTIVVLVLPGGLMSLGQVALRFLRRLFASRAVVSSPAGTRAGEQAE